MDTTGDSLTLLLGAAWLLPLASFTLICLLYSLANLFRIKVGHAGLYGGYIATAAIVIACCLSMVAMFLVWLPKHGLPNPNAHHAHAEHGAHDSHDAHESGERHDSDDEEHQHAEEHHKETSNRAPVKFRFASAGPAEKAALHGKSESHDDHAIGAGGGEEGSRHAGGEAAHAHKPYYTKTWYTLFRTGNLSIDISFYFDTLTVAMFCMVTFIASCIHFYAMGYMHDELHDITDHEVTLEDGEHLHRPGRFHRFFQYLSLFCFSMLGIVISGNVAMTFVFWELVGICSYFLIGFYIERKSASTAANKAFIVNRVGDFGMIIGLMALFGALGTFSFGDEKDADGHVVRQGVFSLVRPETLDGAPNDHRLIIPDGMVLASKSAEVAQIMEENAGLGKEAGLQATETQVAEELPSWRENGAGYWLLVIAGLGIFCGCVGKSAQFPLHVWLPDAMEGPTPVSALVHSATMVAAGVYLVGRFYPVFTPEVLLTIAYIGAITLFVAATIAITATDIKRVLAYSTVSQLGYMMLALGVGGWMAGLFHLFTHAFFKSLLFMCSGSVIHAVHTNDMTHMGGLRKKMPITAYTMLAGCLAIIGASIPFVIGTSGYYSKDAILEQVLLFSGGLTQNGQVVFAGNSFHNILYHAVAGGAAITAFYMFRMWFLTFAGSPRDHHRYDHAHESPKVMTVPLVILAVLAISAGWWLPDAEFLGPLRNFGMRAILMQAQPDGTAATQGPGMLLHEVQIPAESLSHADEIKTPATITAFLAGMSGLLLAAVIYCWRLLDPEEIRQQFRGVHRFLVNKWWFDEIYNFIFVQPVLFVSRRVAEFDKKVLDWIIHTLAWLVKAVSWLEDRWVDRFFIDGLIINGLARRTWNLGVSLQHVQTGRLRQYVMFIVVGTIALFMLISFVWSWGPPVSS